MHPPSKYQPQPRSLHYQKPPERQVLSGDIFNPLRAARSFQSFNPLPPSSFPPGNADLDKILAGLTLTASLEVAPFNPFRFMDLPGELRNNIYREVITSWKDQKVGRQLRIPNLLDPDRHPFLVPLPALAFLSCQVYLEFATLFLDILAKVELDINTVAEVHILGNIFDAVPLNKAWDHISKVFFPEFSTLATPTIRAVDAMNFCKKCPNLEYLSIRVTLERLHTPDFSGASPKRSLEFFHILNSPSRPIQDAEQIAHNYDLSAVFEMPRLQKLVMTCEWSEEWCTPRTMSAFWDLQAWFEVGFKMCGVTEVWKSQMMNMPREMGVFSLKITSG